MGSQISPLLVKRRITLKSLSGSVIGIDALNAIYQFLAIIRLRDGTPLSGPSGEVTSHLSGLFYRTINLLENGIKPVYVFDGKPPSFKAKTLKEREEVKRKFEKEWKEALARGDIVAAFKKSVMTARVNARVIEDSKKLLTLMGIPLVQAPSEAEAQLAYMVQKGDCYAAASQDYDSLLFGTPRLVLNLSIAGKKYYPKRGVVEQLVPELVELRWVLKAHGITREQLIDIAMLVGTDYNEGIKGIGPKRALSLVKKFGCLENVLKALRVEVGFDPDEIRRFYLNPPATSSYNLSWSEPKIDEIRRFLVEEKGFNENRVERGLERLEKACRISSGKLLKLDFWSEEQR